MTYFYLGEQYLKKGNKDKALEAFKKSLELGEPVRSPDSLPFKEARDMIESLEHARPNLEERPEHIPKRTSGREQSSEQKDCLMF